MNLPTSGDGITVRDYFAGQIAAAFIIAPKQPGVLRPEGALLAKMAYEQADLMIAERAISRG